MNARKWYGLIACMLLIGVLHVLPHFIIVCHLGHQYHHIFPMYSADEEHYTVHIKKALEGHYNLSNRYLFEHKYPPQESFTIDPANFIGLVGRTLNLELETLVVAMRFVLPAVAFLLLFVLFKQLGASFALALTAAWANLLAPYALYGQIDFLTRPALEFLSGRGHAFPWYQLFLQASLPYARPVNPQLSGLFFLAALITIVLLIKKPSSLWRLCAVIVFTAMNYRLFFYFWSALGAFALAIAALALFLRRKELLVPVLVLIGLAFFLAFPFLSRVVSGVEHPERFLTEYTIMRAPIFSPACVLAIVLLLPILRRFLQSHPPDQLLYCVPLLTILFCMNQQLVTSKVIQAWHYELFVSPILLSMSLCVLISRMQIVHRAAEKIHQWISSAFIRPAIVLGFTMLAGLLGYATYFLYYFQLAPRLNGSVIICALLALTMTIVLFSLALLLLATVKTPFLYSRWRQILFISAIVIIGMEATECQVYTALGISPRVKLDQHYAGAFHWLNLHAPKDAVILATFPTAEFVPVYTALNVYCCKDALYHTAGGVPRSVNRTEREERILNFFRFAGYDTDQARQLLRTWPYRSMLWGFKTFEPEYDLYSFGRQPLISHEDLETLIRLYTYKQQQPIPTLLQQYRLDFVLYGPREQAEFPMNPRNANWLSLVFDDGTCQVFQQTALRYEK
jgi:hypothetical protein